MKPANEGEVAEAVRNAGVAGKTIRIECGGTRSNLGNPVQADQVLNTSKLTGIELYEPGALTLVAKAGTPIKEIEETLASEGQQLPFEPMDHRAIFATKGNPSIGGVVAGNISGPRRIQAGACRDSLIGVRFIDGRGEQIKNGGRVMKNVTGYDLVKLLCGSFGTLGVITEVAFKVLPAPEATGLLRVNGLDARDAVRAMSKALGSPYDVSAAAFDEGRKAGSSQTLIRVEGFEDSVVYRLEKLSETFAEFGESELLKNSAKAKKTWIDIRDVKSLASGKGDLWRISVKPSDAPDVVEKIKSVDESAQVQLDWGGGLIWVLVAEGTRLREAVNGFRGFVHLVRGEGEVFGQASSRVGQIESNLRKKFDPNGILNPGIMG